MAFAKACVIDNRKDMQLVTEHAISWNEIKIMRNIPQVAKTLDEYFKAYYGQIYA